MTSLAVPEDRCVNGVANYVRHILPIEFSEPARGSLKAAGVCVVSS